MEITFTNTLSVPLDGFEPKPAKNVFPDWLKELPTYANSEKKPTGEGRTAQTIKKCMPVFDAISAGYIIFSYCDIYVSIKDDAHWFEWPQGKPLEFHPEWQAPTYPDTDGSMIPKWINPWGIQTPKGYSCLFIAPVHRKSVFSILEGIVDTDTYNANVNFPFLMKDKNFEGMIPAGTPIAQVIPFKRDDWEIKFGTQEDDLKAKNQVYAMRNNFFDGYKKLFRQNKEYK